MALSSENLALLHDHYKESFSLIRDRESQRDKLFLSLLLFYGLMIVEVQYPANVHGVLGSLTIAGNKVNLQLLPLSLLLSASWVFLAAYILKYCQVTTAVERQYKYLHMLEDRISSLLGDDEVYRREGRAYMSKYPRLLNWAWIAYTFLFPAALILATVVLYVVELTELRRSWLALLFDAIFAFSVIITLVLYRVFPTAKDPQPPAASGGG